MDLEEDATTIQRNGQIEATKSKMKIFYRAEVWNYED